jgi:transcriptional regulator with AAA-type ATPase domain
MGLDLTAARRSDAHNCQVQETTMSECDSNSTTSSVHQGLIYASQRPTLRSKLSSSLTPASIVLKQSLRNLADTIAASPDIPSLIYGETGTGKEEYCKLIHFLRLQRSKSLPFVAVNCANLRGDLALSALFGHKKGAFTGASQDAAGYIGMANGGVLFLDEVHTLDLNSQQRLLRVLNDGVYQRIGCEHYQYSQFQLICASTKDLDSLADSGEFLIDLRMRLMGFEVKLPPLRERKDELPELIRYFLKREGVELPDSIIQDLSTSCSGFYWQGNIRQLFRCLKVLLALSKGELSQIHGGRLPIYKSMYCPEGRSESSTVSADEVTALQPLLKDMELAQALANYEQLVIRRTLQRHHSVTDALKVLGISRSSFAAKRQKYGLIENPRSHGGRLHVMPAGAIEPEALA